eukprot:9463072-Pyramimonas_sp.AAC.1
MPSHDRARADAHRRRLVLAQSSRASRSACLSARALSGPDFFGHASSDGPRKSAHRLRRLGRSMAAGAASGVQAL